VSLKNVFGLIDKTGSLPIRRQKKGGHEDRLFKTGNQQKSRAGWAVVVVTSSNNDAADDCDSSKDSNDYAATAAKLAFFLRSRANALHFGYANSF
jgi:hypothetical protein